MRRAEPCEGQMSLADGEGITGERMMKKAMEWRCSNWAAWSAMKRMADEFASQGRRFSIDQLAVEARYNMRTNGLSDGFKFNNTLRAPLARILISECPHVEPYIETRSSKVDWL